MIDPNKSEAELRQVFADLKHDAKVYGFRGNFNAACVKAYGGVPPNPFRWVQAARAVADKALDDMACAMEAAF